MKRWLLVLIALVLALSGIEGITMAQGDQAKVRAVHAVPGGPPVNVSVNDTKLYTDLSYKDVGDYVDVNAGTAPLRVAPTDSPESPVIDVETDLEANRDYSLVAVGQPDNIEPLLLVDDNSSPPQGKARVRFVHVSPNAPPVDVAQQGGNVIFSDIAYKGVGGYVLLDAGTYTLEVREAGTSNVVLTVPDLRLDSCNVYTIWAMGLLNEQPPLEAVTSTDATTQCATPAPAGATSAPAAAPAVTQAVRPAPTGGTPTAKASGSPTSATIAPTKTVTKAPTKKITLKITKPPITVVTMAPTKGSITLKGTVPPSQPTAPPQQQPQQPQQPQPGGGQGQ